MDRGQVKDTEVKISEQSRVQGQASRARQLPPDAGTKRVCYSLLPAQRSRHDPPTLTAPRAALHSRAPTCCPTPVGPLEGTTLSPWLARVLGGVL